MKKKCKTTHPLRFLSIVWLCFLACPLAAQNYPGADDSVLYVKNTADFAITGDGSAANWSDAVWNNLPRRSRKILTQMGWNVPSSGNDDSGHHTLFKILYSARGIYCLFKCDDSAISATLKKDFLNLYDEDVVEVFLRPDTSMPLYFEYELSPLNFELPILIVNNKGRMAGWRPWQYEGSRKIVHAVKINEKASAAKGLTWTAELFIPFTIFDAMQNVPPRKGTRWRANFYRIDYDGGAAYFSWRLTRQSFHDPEKFGTLQFE